MKIHLLSDLHNEFATYEPSEAAAQADVVVLAGDIDVKCRGIGWAAEVFSVPVIYVPGNHEYYGGHLHKTLAKMRDLAAQTPNVLLGNCDEYHIGGVRFLCATGWTDFSATGNQPLAEWDASQQMRDYRKIRAGEGYRRVRGADFIAENVLAKRWLTERLGERHQGATVVVTHHAPTLSALHPRHGVSHLDAAYANRWDNLLGEVPLWLFGHTHSAMDFMAGETRVLSNPRGYPGEPSGFDPDLIISLSTA